MHGLNTRSKLAQTFFQRRISWNCPNHIVASTHQNVCSFKLENAVDINETHLNANKIMEIHLLIKMGKTFTFDNSHSAATYEVVTT